MTTLRDIQSGLGVLRRGLFSKNSPILGQLVVTRFCNLDCSYCNEFDKVSKPVPLDDLLARVDDLARLDTAIVTCTGGEPLTHPHLSAVIRRIRDHGMTATMNTNGFLLTREHIEALNDAGLEAMQISIDGTEPTANSLKSLKSLRGKLELLHQFANFKININSVIGIEGSPPEDAIEVAMVARSLGFSHSMSLVHDSHGQLKPFTPRQQAVYDKIMTMANSFQHRLNHHLFQRRLSRRRNQRLAMPRRRIPLPLHPANSAWCIGARSRIADIRAFPSAAIWWRTSPANSAPASRARPRAV